MSISVLPNKEEFDILQIISKSASESKFFSNLGGPSGIFIIALYAREMGVSPMTAIFGGFANIQGKITMSAELMNSLIRRAGHKLKINQCDHIACVITGERVDTKETSTVSFSLEEARKAGLVKPGGAWEKYPSDMLFARCLSRLRRRLFPDIVTRAYVEGELEEESPPPITASLLNHPEGMKLDNANIKLIKEEFINRDELKTLMEVLEGDEPFMKKILVHKKIDSMEKLLKKDFEAIFKRIQEYQTHKQTQEKNG